MRSEGREGGRAEGKLGGSGVRKGGGGAKWSGVSGWVGEREGGKRRAAEGE